MRVRLDQPDRLIEDMFRFRGHTIVSAPEDFDVAVFIGGADVCPHLYGEGKHPLTNCSEYRDSLSVDLWSSAILKGLPRVGICRGAQFLCVVNGWRLWQHVPNHAVRATHRALDKLDEEWVDVTSTHHQMMRMPVDWTLEDYGHIIMEANNEGVLDYRISMADGEQVDVREPQIEAVWFEDTKSLCYQPHPEYVEPEHSCQRKFWQYFDTYINKE